MGDAGGGDGEGDARLEPKGIMMRLMRARVAMRIRPRGAY